MFMSTDFVRSQVDFKPFADTIARLVLLNISLLQICKNKSTKDLPDFSTQPDAKNRMRKHRQKPAFDKSNLTQRRQPSVCVRTNWSEW